MPSTIEQIKSEGQDAQKQFYNKMQGVIPFSGRKSIYRLAQDEYSKKQTDVIQPHEVAPGFNPQVQPKNNSKPDSATRQTTNKPQFRNRVPKNIYDTTFENGASQFKEQFTVIPIAGRNEGFKTTMDLRFWSYQGVVANDSASRVKQADNFTKTTLANVVGSMVTNSSNSPQSQNAINKASGKWK